MTAELDLVDPASYPDIIVPAPQTVLISRYVTVGSGTILWPGTVLLADSDGELIVGKHAEIGFEGGFTIDARGQGITIGDKARLLGGGSLTGSNTIGDGAQILGAIRCQRCSMGAGGSYAEADPDKPRRRAQRQWSGARYLA